MSEYSQMTLYIISSGALRVFIQSIRTIFNQNNISKAAYKMENKNHVFNPCGHLIILKGQSKVTIRWYAMVEYALIKQIVSYAQHLTPERLQRLFDDL